MVLPRNLSGCVVEVIEHQVHVLFRLCCQVSTVKMPIVFVDGDSYATRGNVTGGSGAFRH